MVALCRCRCGGDLLDFAIVRSVEDLGAPVSWDCDRHPAGRRLAQGGFTTHFEAICLAPLQCDGVDEARTANRIVLVEFTADWCGNCQYVEAHVLHSNPIVTSVRDHGVVMLKADVTREDAAARPLLDKLNPAGSIPLTVIYPPGVGEPIELTGIYTKEDLQRAIELAARAGTTTLANGT